MKTKKSIAIIKEWRIKRHIYSEILLQVRESYHIGPFTLDSVAKNPIGSLDALQNMNIIAKPTEGFLKLKTSFRSIHHKWWKNNVVN
jgi:hypothetical protein